MPDVPYLAQFQLGRTKYKAVFSILTEVLRGHCDNSDDSGSLLLCSLRLWLAELTELSCWWPRKNVLIMVFCGRPGLLRAQARSVWFGFIRWCMVVHDVCGMQAKARYEPSVFRWAPGCFLGPVSHWDLGFLNQVVRSWKCAWPLQKKKGGKAKERGWRNSSAVKHTRCFARDLTLVPAATLP